LKEFILDNIFKLDEYRADDSVFDAFDIDNLNVVSILFQSGYLTIKSYDGETEEYILGFSNKEINRAFKHNVLSLFSRFKSDNALAELTHALNSNDLETVFDYLKKIFLNIDYDIKLERENNYQSIFYLIFQLLGINIKVEYKTSRGRIDAIVETKNNIYIFEFKLNKTAELALSQIKEMGYADRFTSSIKEIYLIGANFSSSARNIDDYIIEKHKKLS
jgi:hypothetical protein